MQQNDIPLSDPLSEPAFFILLSLAGRPRHGYAVLKDVEELSAGRLELSVSTLYTSLARLVEQGLIEKNESDDKKPAPGLPRKVYRLTGLGKAKLRDEANRLRTLLAAYYLRLGSETR